MSDSDVSAEFEDDNEPLLRPVNRKLNKTFIRDVLAFIVVAINIGCLVGILITVSKRNADIDVAVEAIKQINKVYSQYEHFKITWPVRIQDLTLSSHYVFSLRNGDSVQETWFHTFYEVYKEEPRYCSSDNASYLCIEWTDGKRLEVNVDQQRINSDKEFNCYHIKWSAPTCVNNVLTDCFDVTKSHWYGGFENRFQYWPLERNQVVFTPYVSHDASGYGVGNVLERYFISSKGVGLSIDNNVPLYFSLNHQINGSMCVSALYKRYPYLNNAGTVTNLSYKVCHSESIKDVKGIHVKMSSMLFQKPVGIPHEDLFRYPIWSTWAQYHSNINQSIVLKFANEIISHGFSCGQLEIDDKWTPYYGDFVFDIKKFPNASGMVKSIKRVCRAVTVWVHPFFNLDGSNFVETMKKQYLLRQEGSAVPALTMWWDGNLAGVLDVSNKNAVKWYLKKLRTLQNETDVDSFKFDAGELSWIPNVYDASHIPPNPDENYPARYVDMAAQADKQNRQEVRSAYRTQKYPLFLRQIDKSSKWDHNNGLESIIPGVLTFGILGYPFVLPDMIGGNAYGKFPDSELFVRWIQLNTFLPGMQFSIVPWNNRFKNKKIDVVSISRKFTKLRTEISGTLIKFAKLSLKTGEPIIRPLWWIDPQNDVALKCEDEYLVGDQYLVAPIVTKGARSRDIFLPSGSWHDMLRGNSTQVIQGPKWLYGYEVEIDELAYFLNNKYK